MSSLRRAPALVMLGLALSGCASDTGNPDTGQTTTISGALAARDGRTGRLTLTSPAPAAAAHPLELLAPSWSATGVAGLITLSGTVALSDGTAATLNGSWNTDTGAFSVSGGGFAFAGTISNGMLTGSFTGPDVTGVFSLQVATDPTDNLAVYCGTFTGRQPEALPDGTAGTAPSNGTWNLVVGASTVQLIALGGDAEDPIVAEGSRSGSAVTISVPGGSASGALTGPGAAFVNGTYATAGGDQGTFQGSAAACTATTETGTIAQLVLNAPGLLPGDERNAFDSTLAYVTAFDASGNFVAAPDLTWDFPANDQFIRTNAEVTRPGQQWVVLQSPAGSGTGTPPQLVTRTFRVTSRNQPSVAVTGTVVVYWNW